MKEKIWIEKLIKLLNEYEYFKELKEVPEEEKDLFVQKIFWHESYWVLNSYWCEDYEILKRKFCYMYAISNEYWFIQWLVENDKIDIVKVYENLTDYEIEIRIRAVKELLENNEEDTISYLKLLMLLSIQDEPIRFLCEIIK